MPNTPEVLLQTTSSHDLCDKDYLIAVGLHPRPDKMQYVLVVQFLKHLYLVGHTFFLICRQIPDTDIVPGDFAP
jgi:hypothetical protein